MLIVSTTPRTNLNLDDFKKIVESTNYSYLQLNPNSQQFDSNEMKKILADCQIAIIGDDEIDSKAIQDAVNLKHIIKWGSGTDSIDFEATSNKNISVTNTPGVFVNTLPNMYSE